MSTSSYKRLPLAGLSILIVWTLIDILAHRLFLAPIYASTPHLWRPFDQMNIALIYSVTFGLVAIFVASYRLLVRGQVPPGPDHSRATTSRTIRCNLD